jgi:hypothetical protein
MEMDYVRCVVGTPVLCKTEINFILQLDNRKRYTVNDKT